ncbi:DUF2141 domain-containing protein [Spongiivirga citrea]|uniref:DUF2141 domain-containing protein n=1 Tax=Spongiivirga citrea TaxID=1481457 RepID=A0A6M0CVB5_9FLAO|nr:DUF2141 domain-containing protein [Spongiivirga citrea]NER17710.1 DUF2141 domain-containing protein [Spongiivirga citrea]
MKKVILISFLLIAFSIGHAQEAGSIKVNVINASSDEGKVLIGLYDSEASFLKKTYKGTMAKPVDGKCQVIFKDIPYGEYAVSIFHDENDNNKLDTNFMGIPKEDNACSNQAKGFMGPPKYKDAKFTLGKESITIPIKL